MVIPSTNQQCTKLFKKSVSQTGFEFCVIVKTCTILTLNTIQLHERQRERGRKREKYLSGLATPPEHLSQENVQKEEHESIAPAQSLLPRDSDRGGSTHFSFFLFFSFFQKHKP